MQMRFHPDLLTMIKLEWKTVEVVNQFTRYTLLKCYYMQLTTLIIIEKKRYLKEEKKSVHVAPGIRTWCHYSSHTPDDSILQYILQKNSSNHHLSISITAFGQLLHKITIYMYTDNESQNTHTIFWF